MKFNFKRAGNIWHQEAYLKAPNADSGDRFGDFVAIDENTVILGAPYKHSSSNQIINGPVISDTNQFPYAGAAYIFIRD